MTTKYFYRTISTTTGEIKCHSTWSFQPTFKAFKEMIDNIRAQDLIFHQSLFHGACVRRLFGSDNWVGSKVWPQ